MNTTNLLLGVLVWSFVFPIRSLLMSLHANKSTLPLGQSIVGLQLNRFRFASLSTLLLLPGVSGLLQFYDRFGLTLRGLGLSGITVYNTSSIAFSDAAERPGLWSDLEITDGVHRPVNQPCRQD